jgi:S-adenosylmethionine:tRNA ribosyltransferase-isomerase
MTKEDPMTPTLIPPDPLAFDVPPELEAGVPPEARGLCRDDVRLLVSHRRTSDLAHRAFRDLPQLLEPGDLLVINTSGTLPAALPAVRGDGAPLALHLSTRLPGGLWCVEVRRPVGAASVPFHDVHPGETLALPAGGACTLLRPYRYGQRISVRLWLADLDLTCPLLDYLARHGSPIHYSYVRTPWPIDAYQTVYATEPGSAEMPSAGRAFTPALLAALVARGIAIAPLLLHTGVASLEGDEAPYEEPYRVPAATARLVNLTHASGGRVIAVGTTVVRALETVADATGTTHPGEGWTGLVIDHAHHMRAVDALLTGLHEPRSTHLAMLEALAGRSRLERAYAELLRERYLWHEFGDLHLILP